MKTRLRRRAVIISIVLGLVAAVASAASAQTVASERIVAGIEPVVGLTLRGLNTSDHMGLDVASGDVNDDGVDDLVVGARLGDPNGVLNAGVTYVFYGPLEPGTVDPAAADVTVNGIDPKSQAGRSLAVFDVNDDGADDLVLGAVLASPDEGRAGAGEAYVVFGPIGPGVVELSTQADIVLEGIAERDHLGSGADGGDLNDDGVADLVLGAVGASPDFRSSAGAAFIVFGPMTAGSYRLEQMVDVTVQGIDIGDQLGYGVGVGDFNRDGVQDLLMGAQGASPPGRIDSGVTYVIFGPLASGKLELLLEADIIIEGAARGDLSGGDTTAGDINNDGIDDVVIGSQWSDAGSRNIGQAAVFLGPLDGQQFDLSTADLTYNGIDSGEMTGGGLALGDIDDDGLADLIIGAGLADNGEKNDAGAVYVIFGSALPFPQPEPAVGLSALQIAGLAVLVFLIVAPIAYWMLRRRQPDGSPGLPPL